jgi:hypothetical protein
LVHGDEQLDLIGFAAANEQRWIRAFATRNDARDRKVAGRLCEQGELVERLIKGRRAADFHAHQNGTRRIRRVCKVGA